MGGIATNEITSFWWKQKRGSGSGGSGTKILKSTSLVLPSYQHCDRTWEVINTAGQGPAQWPSKGAALVGTEVILQAGRGGKISSEKK